MIDGILGVLGSLIYPLFSVVFSLMDLLQVIFGAFAGVNTINYDGTPITSENTGLETETGIVYYLLTSDVVVNMFWSMVILAIVLLLIFTTMTFLRNIYSAQPKNWKVIVGNAIKGLANFIIVPVLSLLGVWLGNIVLQAVNGATSTGDAITLSRQLFITSAYNANRTRIETGVLSSTEIEEIQVFCDQYGVTYDSSSTDREYWAEKVDEVFTSGVSLASWSFVNAWYDLMSINYLVLAVGGIYILYVLGSISFGMVRRLLLLLVLFIISPIVCSLYPHDEGAAVKSWRGKFVQQVLSAYSAVAGMNLFFALTPLMQNIDIGNWGIDNFMGGLLNLILLIAGLYVVKEVIDLINGFVGGDNAYGTGHTLMKNTSIRLRSVQGRANKMTKGTVGAFSKAIGSTKTAREQFEKGEKGRAGAGAKAFFGSLGGSIGTGLLGKTNDKGQREGGLLQTVNNKLFGIDAQDIANTASSQYQAGREVGKNSRAMAKARNQIKEMADGGLDFNSTSNQWEYQKKTGKQVFDPKTGKMVDETKTESIKPDDLYKIVSNAGMDNRFYAGLGMTKEGKPITKEDFEKEVSLSKAVSSARESFNKHVTASKDLLTQTGLDNAGIAVMSTPDLQQRQIENRKWADADLAEATIKNAYIEDYKSSHKGKGPDPATMNAFEAQARAIARERALENQAIDKYQAEKVAAETSSKELVSAMEAYNKESKVGAVNFSNESMTELKTQLAEAIKTNDTSVVKALATEIDDLSKNMNKSNEALMKSISKDIDKLIAESKKSEKGNKDGSKK